MALYQGSASQNHLDYTICLQQQHPTVCLTMKDMYNKLYQVINLAESFLGGIDNVEIAILVFFFVIHL